MVSDSTLLVEQEYRATTTVIEAPIEDMISTGTRLDNKRIVSFGNNCVKSMKSSLWNSLRAFPQRMNRQSRVVATPHDSKSGGK